jgi:Flp pilus assembly protein TadB
MSATDPRRDMSALYARRRQARRRRSLARLDVALGLLVAVFALVIAPGIAIVAIVALLAIVVCAVSILVERRRSRRRARSTSSPTGPRRRGRDGGQGGNHRYSR